MTLHSLAGFNLALSGPEIKQTEMIIIITIDKLKYKSIPTTKIVVYTKMLRQYTPMM